MHLRSTSRFEVGIVALALILVGCASAASPTAAPPTAAPPTAAPPTAAAPSAATSNAPSAVPSFDINAMPPAEVTSIKFSISANDPHQSPLQIALDAGLFQKYGLTATGSLIEGNAGTQAVLAGQIDVETGTSTETMTTQTTNNPMVDIAVIENKLPDYVYAGKGITGAADLKGKKAAINAIGSQSATEIRVAMKLLGLAPTDMSLVTIGGQGARVAALEAGTVALAAADPALAPKLAAEGILPIEKLPETDVIFPGSNVLVLRSFAEKNPGTTLRICAAVLEAVQLPYTNLPLVVKSYAKWAQMSEADSQSTWDAYLGSGIAQRDLYSTQAGYITVRDEIATVAATLANVDVTKAYNFSFLDKLKEMGLYHQLGVPGY